MKKLAAVTMRLLRRGFNSSKCKTEAKLATARIKLLRNRREAQLRQMRRDIAELLQSGHDETAMIRVEHIIREQNVMAANEIIELFCELIVVRLPIIAKARDCPGDLKEGISSLIYAAPRCSEIPELCRMREIFEKKYGKDFVSAGTDLRPESGVNLMLVEKLSVRKPSGEVKLKVLKEIAKEYQVKWDARGTEAELLKPLVEVLDGPQTFISSSSMPLKSTISHLDEQQKEARYDIDMENYSVNFKDSASAAQAAAVAAEKAALAAQAAAFLAKQSPAHSNRTGSFHDSALGFKNRDGPRNHSLHTSHSFTSNISEQKWPSNSRHSLNTSDSPSLNNSIESRPQQNASNFYDSTNFANLKYGADVESLDTNDPKFSRRERDKSRNLHSDIKFDDSDGLDSEVEDEVRPPCRPPHGYNLHEDKTVDEFGARRMNQNSRIHPKLPDYEELTARFEALRSSRKS